MHLNSREKELGPIYMAEGIPLYSPRERARYLDGKLDIENEGLLEKTALSLCKREGKGSALLFLEAVAIEKFF
jgi:hypothetical protein